jgi:hypothetical protein
VCWQTREQKSKKKCEKGKFTDERQEKKIDKFSSLTAPLCGKLFFSLPSSFSQTNEK